MKRRYTTIRKPGFTLLEVVLVLAIIMVLGAVAAPRYASANARYRADFAVQRIAADLALAQHTARTAGQVVKIAFDLSANDYLMTGVEALDGSGNYAVSLDEPPYQAMLTVAEFGSSHLPSLQFDGWGVSTSSGTVKISVGPEQRTLTFDRVSGGVTIE